MGLQKSSEGNGCVHYLDCGDDFPGIYMSKLTKLYTLNICSLLYFNYTSVKDFPEIKPLWLYSYKMGC